MGDEDNRTFIILEVILKPSHSLGVQMVGRFVHQQHVRFGQEQLANRDTARFTAREIIHGPIFGWAAKGLHGHVDFTVDIPSIVVVHMFLKRGHLFHEFVGVFFGHFHGDSVVFVKDDFVRAA